MHFLSEHDNFKEICEKNLKNKDASKINELVHQNRNQSMPKPKSATVKVQTPTVQRRSHSLRVRPDANIDLK